LVAELPVDVLVYDATRIADPREARRACLVRLVADLAEVSAHRLVIERDESLLRSDRETLYRAVRQSGVEDLLVYEHLTPRVEPLLWIPDAVAWCWSKGGWWREGVDPLVRQIKTLR
jgi:hypothetical protein